MLQLPEGNATGKCHGIFTQTDDHLHGELDEQYHLRNLHSYCSIIRPVFKRQSQTT